MPVARCFFRAAALVALLVAAPALADGLPPITAGFRDGPAARLVAVRGAYPQKHAAEITAVGFSADGKVLVTAGGERRVKLWDARRGDELMTVGVASGRSNAVGVVGGALFAASSTGVVASWDVASGAPAGTYSHGSPVLVACADGDALVAAGRDGAVKRWREPGPGRVVGRHPGAAPLACAGARVLFSDGAVVDGGATVADVGGPLDAGAFVRDGAAVVVAAGDVVRLVELAGGASRELLRSGRVAALAASADGARVVVAGIDRRVTALDVASGRRIVDRVVAAPAALTAVAVSPDGSLAITASRDTRFERWDLATGRRLPRAAGVPLRPASLVATAGALALHGRATGLELRHGRTLLVHERTRRAVAAVAFSADHRRAAAVDDAGQLTLVDVAARKVTARVAAHDGPALALAFLPDGGVVTAGDDHLVRRWDAAGRRVAELALSSTVTAVAASPDGARVVAGERAGFVHVWDGRAATAAAIDLRASDDWPLAIAFSRDGKQFSVGTQRGVTLIFE